MPGRMGYKSENTEVYYKNNKLITGFSHVDILFVKLA